MELHKVAERIEEKINQLETGRKEIKTLALNKAEAIMEYEKKMAITIIKLRNGETMELDGEMIIAPQATLIDKIARGICYIEKLESDTADGLYKAGIVGMSSIEAQLNGYQSINRHISEL